MSGTRDKILEAADDLFGQVGYDAATTREIAERCQVNKALIHYHFKNKEGLLASVLDRYYEKLAGTLQGALSGQESLRERMLRLVDTYMDFLSENRNFNRIVQREASGGKHMDRISEHMAPLFQLGTALIQGTYPSTRTGEMSATQLLVSFFGMAINYFTYNRLLEQLTGADPLSGDKLDMRKRHLRRMIEILVDVIEEQESQHVS
ncbi:MAG: TetR/AcrR family transcriptional regulator [Deltaproteobacteria bacterium]|nr:TetR/AcrR family transcriptional regulator [Deltaproteobacteria bacterium]